jgi:CBS domain containing-hemolysin-like protein
MVPRIDLDDLNILPGVDLPTDEADMLGGLIYNELGRVPVVGDKVRVNDLSIEVMSVVGRRIEMVRLVNLSPRADAVGLGGRLSLQVIVTENSPDIAHRR